MAVSQVRELRLTAVGLAVDNGCKLEVSPAGASQELRHVRQSMNRLGQLLRFAIPAATVEESAHKAALEALGRKVLQIANLSDMSDLSADFFSDPEMCNPKGGVSLHDCALAMVAIAEEEGIQLPAE